MATYAKGLPASVSAFAHAADQLAPEQHSYAAQPSAVPAHFRADASSSSHAAAAEFGQFAQRAQPVGASIGATLDPREAAWERGHRGGRFAGAPPPPAETAIAALNSQCTGPASHDGDAVFSLLSGSDSLIDAVDGDWERALAHERHLQRLDEAPPPLPADPLASKSCPPRHSASGTPQVHPGDMSPTSQSLLASVASLSLAEQTYLRTLLASQDPASMFEDYFSHATYTDDVWTPPPNYVRKVLDRAVDEGKGKQRAADDEGKAKAVRRLEMLLRHLEGQVTARSSPSSSSTVASAPVRGGHSWAHEHAATRVGPDQASVGLVRAQGDQQSSSVQHLGGSEYAYSTATTYAPSSLSSSAFVSFAPTSAASSMPAQQPRASHAVEKPSFHPQRPAAPARTGSYASSHASAESHASDASYEEYVREKEARMRSNEGGRFGPDFTARAVSVPLESPSTAGREEETGSDVTEGRTH